MEEEKITPNKEELQRRQKLLLDELVKVSEQLIKIKQDELHVDLKSQIDLLELKKRISHE